MIHLNGCSSRWFSAAGAFGFDGMDTGHPLLVRLWKLPFRVLGILKSRDMIVVSKTVTMEPTIGNLSWDFWRAALPLAPLADRSMVNAVALTNPGFDFFLRVNVPAARRHGIKLVSSLQPHDPKEAAVMGRALASYAPWLAGIEVNAGCPNVSGEEESEEDSLLLLQEVVRTLRFTSGLPIIVKWGYYQPFEKGCKLLAEDVTAFNLINAVPFYKLSPYTETSPLERYGYQGSVSGGRINALGRDALMAYRNLNLPTPVISGGGIVSHYRTYSIPGFPISYISLQQAVRERFRLGADAVAFGTTLLWEPWRAGKVMADLDREAASRRFAFIMPPAEKHHDQHHFASSV